MKRSGFEAMIARATDGARTVDAILVFSFSRAFRNQVEQELTAQTLRKASRGTYLFRRAGD
jgi:site-specific DNA recombinase